jgi:hypothetical protein
VTLDSIKNGQLDRLDGLGGKRLPYQTTTGIILIKESQWVDKKREKLEDRWVSGLGFYKRIGCDLITPFERAVLFVAKCRENFIPLDSQTYVPIMFNSSSSDSSCNIELRFFNWGKSIRELFNVEKVMIQYDDEQPVEVKNIAFDTNYYTSMIGNGHGVDATVRLSFSDFSRLGVSADSLKFYVFGSGGDHRFEFLITPETWKKRR